jgi:hypothetical protein
MNNNKVTIEQAKQQIMEGYSSILTREDVLHLLDCLEVNTGKIEIDDSAIDDLSSEITDTLNNEGCDIVDDYTLTMNYGREVELDSIDLNGNKIKAAVKDAVYTFIENLKEEAST